MARTVQEIEKAIAQLPKNQLRQFRAWYKNFDSDAWYEQIENDIAGGKLDGVWCKYSNDPYAIVIKQYYG